jgi:predicted DNA-binding transcriptional regulator AlpA
MQPTPKPQRTRASYAPIASGLTPDARIKLPQIIGDPKAEPPLPGIFQASRTQFYRLIQQGKFPAPLKPFPGCRASYWRYGDVLAAIRKLEADAEGVRYEPPVVRKRSLAQEGA